MRPWLVPMVLSLAGLFVVPGCTSSQLQENTLEQIATIGSIRYDQLLTSISAAIDLKEPVPALGVLSSGTVTSTDTGTLALVLPAMNFSKNTRTLNPTATVTWTDNWSIGPISDPQDLQNLRALYSFIYRSDNDIAHLIRQFEILFEMGDRTVPHYTYAQGDCGINYNSKLIYNKMDANSIGESINSANIVDKDRAMVAYLNAFHAYPSTENVGPEDQLESDSREDCFEYDSKGIKRFPDANWWTRFPKPAKESEQSPKLSKENQQLFQELIQQLKQQAGPSKVNRVTAFYGLIYPTPDQVRDSLRNGTSFECGNYEIKTIAALWSQHPSAEPTFARWLFWRDVNGQWKPREPLPTEELETLGVYGGKEFYTSSRACLNDFIVLAMASTANSHAAAQASPKSPAANSP